MTTIMTTKTMTLEALSKEYLIARVDVAEARAAVKSAKGRVEIWEAKNAGHAKEVAEKRRESSYPGGPRFRTNQQVSMIGSGSGYEVIYSRCRHTGDERCAHEATASPFTEDDIATGRKQITAAEKRLTKAETRLAGTLPTFDVVVEARKQGSRFVWWPASRFLDPRKFRYRGLPITADELAEVGPIELQRLITAGEIVDVSL